VNEDQIKYMQAVNRQKLDQSPHRVVLVERLSTCYRLTTASGIVTYLNSETGAEWFPLAVCGKDP
jgi:hypothetical protein